MISHVPGYSLAHGEKSSISNIFFHTKREYGFSACPIGCTPAFSYLNILSISSFEISFNSGMPGNLGCGVDKS